MYPMMVRPPQRIGEVRYNVEGSRRWLTMAKGAAPGYAADLLMDEDGDYITTETGDYIRFNQ
jgi:hypothetical protein